MFIWLMNHNIYNCILGLVDDVVVSVLFKVHCNHMALQMSIPEADLSDLQKSGIYCYNYKSIEISIKSL
jgi:hypothetical protein